MRDAVSKGRGGCHLVGGTEWRGWDAMGAMRHINGGITPMPRVSVPWEGHAEQSECDLMCTGGCDSWVRDAWLGCPGWGYLEPDGPSCPGLRHPVVGAVSWVGLGMVWGHEIEWEYVELGMLWVGSPSARGSRPPRTVTFNAGLWATLSPLLTLHW